MLKFERNQQQNAGEAPSVRSIHHSKIFHCEKKNFRRIKMIVAEMPAKQLIDFQARNRRNY